MADIIDIARIMRNRSCAKDLAGTCKEMLGTCVSVGCTVDHEDPRDVQSKVHILCNKRKVFSSSLQIAIVCPLVPSSNIGRVPPYAVISDCCVYCAMCILILVELKFPLC